MVNIHNNLYSVGPNSVGPGTWITQSQFNPRRNRGVVTRMYQNTDGITTEQLAALHSISPDRFPGTVTPLSYTYIKQMSDTLALVVSNYGPSSGANGFRRVMSRTPSGYRQIPFWDVSEAYTSNRANYTGPIENGALRPRRNSTIPLVVVRWSSIVYTENRPNDNAGLIGRVNSNVYTIDGYVHAPETLVFGGTQVSHDRYGGHDRWTLAHTATYDASHRHRDAEIVRGDQRADGTWNFTLANGGNGVQNNIVTAFPNLP